MAGTAKTNRFMLSTATVMLGPLADLHDLNPTEHSIGLVKNFNLMADPTYTELTQGVKNSIVFSTMTANPVRASMEVYEYTAKNLAYSLGLDASAIEAETVQTTVATAVDDDPAQNTVAVTSATGIVAGDTILIERNTVDDFVIRVVESVSTNTLTLDENLPAIAIGAKVFKVNAVEVGSKEDQPFLAAKIAGKTANGEPIVILLPKIRITKGFNIGFVSDNYANLPFEITVYDLAQEDAHFDYFDGAQAMLFTR